MCSSPKLIAAYRVLLRPPMPRHPSCALSSLTTKNLLRLMISHQLLKVYCFSQHKKLLVVCSFEQYLLCRIFFKTFSLIVNQPPSSIPDGFNRNYSGKSFIVSNRSPIINWWAYLELNQGPRPYQGRALTN